MLQPAVGTGLGLPKAELLIPIPKPRTHRRATARTAPRQLASSQSQPSPSASVQGDPGPGIPLVLSSESSKAITRVAELASAWAKVARRLPPTSSTQQEQLEQIIKALRLALTWLDGHPLRKDGRSPSARSVQLAATLAELAAAGLPLDANAIAAGVLLEAADTGFLDADTIRAQLGPDVSALVHDILLVRSAPSRVELYDDVASSAIREWVLTLDVRACVVEVVSRWDELGHMGALQPWDRQALALEALQIYAPLGHALGLGAVSAAMEDICFKVLFPESYQHTREWLHTVVDPAEDALYAAQQQLLAALDRDSRFQQLASGCVLRTRTKSMFSLMKKLLRLGDMSKGGRRREEVFDLLGMRAVVQPRQDLPPEEAEAAAIEACYVVQSVAQSLWTCLPDRTKDYIAFPKANGYKCIHLTVCMKSVMRSQHPGHPSTTNGQHESDSAYATELQPAEFTSTISSTTTAWGASQTSTSTGSSSTASSAGSVEGSVDGMQGGSCLEEGRGEEEDVVADSMAAPFLELQIRTQAMDDRAESGQASHMAYKGGLDSRQARQLAAWTQELQARLSVKPQGRLLLPPSIVARQEGMPSVLASIDLFDDEPAAPIPLPPPTTRNIGSAIPGIPPASDNSRDTITSIDGAPATLVSNSLTSLGRSQQPSQQQDTTLSQPLPAAGLPLNSSSSLSSSSSPSSSSFSTSRTPPSAAPLPSASAQVLGPLFKFWDRDGNGRISLDELQEQLQQLDMGSQLLQPDPEQQWPPQAPGPGFWDASGMQPGAGGFPPQGFGAVALNAYPPVPSLDWGAVGPFHGEGESLLPPAPPPSHQQQQVTSQLGQQADPTCQNQQSPQAPTSTWSLPQMPGSSIPGELSPAQTGQQPVSWVAAAAQAPQQRNESRGETSSSSIAAPTATAGFRSPLHGAVDGSSSGTSRNTDAGTTESTVMDSGNQKMAHGDTNDPRPSGTAEQGPNEPHGLAEGLLQLMRQAAGPGGPLELSMNEFGRFLRSLKQVSAAAQQQEQQPVAQVQEQQEQGGPGNEHNRQL